MFSLGRSIRTSEADSSIIQVFIGFSTEDAQFHRRLLRHLSPLLGREFQILPDVAPGEPWESGVLRLMDEAHIILLLVSPDLFGTEGGSHLVNWAMERQAHSKIIPVLVRPAAWQETELGRLPPLPQDGKPLTLRGNVDEGLLDVVIGLSQYCKLARLPADRDSSHQFTPALIAQMAVLRRTIRQLTEEQYDVIRFLHGHRRVSIAGCAGSGKTLVAVEKALRLDRAGLRTLLLCHNPYLAEKLQQLVRETGVVALDFVGWIRQLLGQTPNSSARWTHFEEPTDADLDRAYDVLMESSKRYDAVIIDEGQDFRELWWVIVEAAIAHPETGHLYVFHDDHQALLPHRGVPPIKDSPYTLTKNCRNAGKIYALVSHFHPTAPPMSSALANQGVVRTYQYAGRFEPAKVMEAIQEAALDLSTMDLVVLTTEPDPVSQSLLCGLDVALLPPWKWQDRVTELVSDAFTRLQHHAFAAAKPKLSSAHVPTDADILAIARWAGQEIERRGKPTNTMAGWPWSLRNIDPREVASDGFCWRQEQGRLEIVGSSSALRLLSFFSTSRWAEKLPLPQRVRIVPGEGRQSETGRIPLYTVPAYKGLESDGVILFDTMGMGNTSKTYVAISRAVALLHIVSQDSTLCSYLWQGSSLASTKRTERTGGRRYDGILE